MRNEKNYGKIAISLFGVFLVLSIYRSIWIISSRDINAYDAVDFIVEYFVDYAIFDFNRLLYIIVGIISIITIIKNKVGRMFKIKAIALFIVNIIFIFISIYDVISFIIFILGAILNGAEITGEGSIQLYFGMVTLELVKTIITTIIVYIFMKIVNVYFKNGKEAGIDKYTKDRTKILNLSIISVVLIIIVGVIDLLGEPDVQDIIYVLGGVSLVGAYIYLIKWFLFCEHDTDILQKTENTINLFGVNANGKSAIDLKNEVEFQKNIGRKAEMTMEEKVEILKGYKELLDSGIITVEEFEAKKNEVL